MRGLYIALLLLLTTTTLIAQTLTEFEYFFDTEPGLGNGTAVTANANTGTLTQTLSIPLTGLTEGFHKVLVRAKDDNNVWGMYSSAIFYISDFAGSGQVPDLATAEYYFGADPGIGSGTALTVPTNTGDMNTSYAIPLGTLPAGFHTLTMRAQDTNGTWGFYNTVHFYVSEFNSSDPPEDIVAVEYWFDTDPGMGNATSITFTPSGEVNQTLPIPLYALPVGFHKVGIRTQNAAGIWSMYEKKLFYVGEDQTISPLTEAEFLYDAELGFGTGTSVAITPTGNPDEYEVAIPTNLVTCDIHDVSLTIKNAAGNYSMYQIALEVDVYDNAPPTIVSQNITVELDATGNVSISASDVDNGTFDDCELVSVVIDITDFTCADLGENNVTITATDAEAKVSTGTVIVTVVDVINPVAIGQDMTVQLGADGTVTLDASTFDNGSTDNCAIASFSLDPATLDCSHLGVNNVAFTAIDTSGNTNTTNVVITVEDVMLPTVLTQDITVQLDATGNASIEVSDIDNGSSDNCAIASSTLDITTFTCADIGENTVILTVIDTSGNTDTNTAVVTVEDNLAPIVVAQDITVSLGIDGTATVAATAIDNGSTDNCEIASYDLDISSFDCSTTGPNNVILTVTDVNGNSATAPAIITVLEDILPVAIAQDITVILVGNMVVVDPSQIDNGSTDNCLIAELSLDIDTFDCEDVGENNVVLTVTDASGNAATAPAIITVVDDELPQGNAQDITVFLDASGNVSITPQQIDDNSTDNCSIVSYNLDVSTFDCNDVGENTVTLTVTDPSGNSDNVSAIVTVEDNLLPQAIAQNITVILDPSGSATITPEDVDNGSFDNCGLVSMSLDITMFDCLDLGDNTVTLTVFDVYGNTSTATSIVTVEGILTTYTAGTWDMGAPNLGSRAVISSPLATGGTSLEACTCEVNASLTVQDGDYLLVNGDIQVNSTLTVDHQGSVVQIDDNASVTNSGAITVEKITPMMAAKSFMISGSPMTGETREGVFGSGYIVRNHVTANFIPNPDVEAVSPGINNWADDNGNNWLNHTGTLNAGEGYMVFPQPDGTSSGMYTQNHTSGTLNNGEVNFNLGYNGTQNASPNMLANPYASAIDVELFFDHPANSNIDVVYFWEHITPLSVTYPGYNEANFSMGDISVYSESLGSVGATNGGAAPTQFISSGQGFGVKPLAGGIATFNNAMRVTGPNDTYRSNTLNRDRLWMRVYNDTYGLGSTALIGFTENTSDEFINSEDVYRLPTPVSLYSELDTGEELVINALGSFEISDAFYLSFSTQVKEPQEYRISISDMDGVNFETVSVYLIDNLMGSVTNLTEGDYTFQSGEAIYHNRFKVVFENSVLGTNETDLRSISLYPNPTENIVTIVSPNLMLSSATIFDIRGRKVSEVDFRNQTSYQIDLSSMEAAVYFIDIVTENGSVMKRIMKN